MFELICRRFLSIFYPPAEYDNVKLVVAVLKENFFASAKVLKSEGYLEVATPPKKRNRLQRKMQEFLAGQTCRAITMKKKIKMMRLR